MLQRGVWMRQAEAPIVEGRGTKSLLHQSSLAPEDLEVVVLVGLGQGGLSLAQLQKLWFRMSRSHHGSAGHGSYIHLRQFPKLIFPDSNLITYHQVHISRIKLFVS